MNTFFALVLVALTQSGQIIPDGNLLFNSPLFDTQEQCTEARVSAAKAIVEKLPPEDAKRVAVICVGTAFSNE